VELESWDVWNSDDKANVTQKTNVANRSGNRYQGMKPREPELEPEVDYFQELQLEPSISKTKKVCRSLCLLHVITVPHSPAPL